MPVRVATVGLGLGRGAGLLARGRPGEGAGARAPRGRTRAGKGGLRWAAVRAFRFDRRFRWATLLLTNDDEFAVLAVQGADGDRAVDAVEGLRTLLAASRAHQPPPPPLLHDD